MDGDSTVQSDAIGMEPSRAEPTTSGLLLLASICEIHARTDHPIGPSSSYDNDRQPEYGCNDHSDDGDNQNADKRNKEGGKSQDDDGDEDWYNVGHHTSSGGRVAVHEEQSNDAMQDAAGKDVEEDTSVSDVDSEYCAYFNYDDYIQMRKRITYNYPCLRKDSYKHYKYLKKELCSESLVIYNGPEQIQLGDMLQLPFGTWACNVQRTCYFMCPPEGAVTQIQLRDPLDGYVSYIKAHIDEPIIRPNVIIKDPVPDDYLFKHVLETSSKSDIPLYTEVDNDIETLGDTMEQKTGKGKIELVANAPLIVAILQKKWYIAKTLLDLGADVGCKSSSGRTAFHEALRHNWVPSDIAERLITNDSIDMQDERGRTALHLLIRIVYDVSYGRDLFTKYYYFVGDKYWKPRFDIVKTLCERGADVNICDAFGVLPLHMALYCDFCYICPETLKLLVTENNVNTADRFGCPPLHLAIHNTSWDLAAFFIEKGASINEEGTSPGDTFPFPLHLALWFAEEDVPSNLLEQLMTDNNINKSSPHGEPLFLAITGRHYENLRTLVARGADINSMVTDGIDDFPSSLHAYMYLGDQNSPSDIVTMLASQSNINERRLDSEHLEYLTPLLVALKPKRYPFNIIPRSMCHCVPELIKAGADVNMRTKNTTPLLRALAFEDPSETPMDILKLLVSTEIVNVSIDNQTAFRRAFETGRWELICLLLQYGADGPDVCGVVAAARTASHNPHEGGRFDEKTNSLLDITIDIMRDFLPGFSDDDFCILQDLKDIGVDDNIITQIEESMKRGHLYEDICHFKKSKSTPKEREDLMNLILRDYKDCTRL